MKFILLLLSSVIVLSQIYGIDYDKRDTTCSGQVMRTWSSPITSENCTFGSATGYKNYEDNKYVFAKCSGSVGNRRLTLSACSQVGCQICIPISSPNILEGECFGSHKYYCERQSQHLQKASMIYSEYSDSVCSNPFDMNPYNQSRLNCYNRGPERSERSKCIDGGKKVELTFWTPISGDPPLTSCSGSISYTNIVNVGECVKDHNLNGLRYIRIEQCSGVGDFGISLNLLLFLFFLAWISPVLPVFQILMFKIYNEIRSPVIQKVLTKPEDGDEKK
jgi:hypothetical protein